MTKFLTKSPSTKSWLAIMTAFHLSRYDKRILLEELCPGKTVSSVSNIVEIPIKPPFLPFCFKFFQYCFNDFNHKWFQTSKYCRDGLQTAGTARDRKEPTKATQGRSLWKISQVLTTLLMLNLMLMLNRKKVGGKGGGAKAKPKFKSYAEARKDREKFRKKLVSSPLWVPMYCNDT